MYAVLYYNDVRQSRMYTGLYYNYGLQSRMCTVLYYNNVIQSRMYTVLLQLRSSEQNVHWVVLQLRSSEQNVHWVVLQYADYSMNGSVVQSVHLALCFLKKHGIGRCVPTYSYTLHKRPLTYWLVGCNWQCAECDRVPLHE